MQYRQSSTSADEMDQADEELRETIKIIWPLHAKNMVDLLVPPVDQLNNGKMSVGKIYATYLILESWRTTRFGQMEASGGNQGFGNSPSANHAAMELQDVLGSRRPSCDSLADQHLHPTGYPNTHRRSPSIRRGNSPSLQRSPSPRRRYPSHLHHDIGFSDTVSNVVEIVKHEHHRSSQRHRCRGSWSASTSPARSPSPTNCSRHYNTRHGPHRSSRRGAYGTTSLCQRSRSPSPTHPVPHQHGPPTIAFAVVGLPMQHSAAHQASVQHSHPMLGGRRGQGRRLPPTPCKPSTLQLRPGPINFPKLNASPTHLNLQLQQSHSAHATPHSVPHNTNLVREREPLREMVAPPVRDTSQAPLSFEQAVALGRGGRMLPSPVPNGYKPKPTRSRHSDSDDDDWC